MAIHKVIEVISQEQSWEDAAQRAVADAGKTVDQIKSIWIKNFEAVVKDNKIVVTAREQYVCDGVAAAIGPAADVSRDRPRGLVSVGHRPRQDAQGSGWLPR